MAFDSKPLTKTIHLLCFSPRKAISTGLRSVSGFLRLWWHGGMCISSRRWNTFCQSGDTIELMTSHPALTRLMRASRNTVPLHSSFTAVSSVFEAANWGFSLRLLACYHQVSHVHVLIQTPFTGKEKQIVTLMRSVLF